MDKRRLTRTWRKSTAGLLYVLHGVDSGELSAHATVEEIGRGQTVVELVAGRSAFAENEVPVRKRRREPVLQKE